MKMFDNYIIYILAIIDRHVERRINGNLFTARGCRIQSPSWGCRIIARHLRGVINHHFFCRNTLTLGGLSSNWRGGHCEIFVINWIVLWLENNYKRKKQTKIVNNLIYVYLPIYTYVLHQRTMRLDKQVGSKYKFK